MQCQLLQFLEQLHVATGGCCLDSARQLQASRSVPGLMGLERRAIALQAVRFLPLTSTQVNLICFRWLFCERNDPSRGVSAHGAAAGGLQLTA
jgi:hypothetical protein